MILNSIGNFVNRNVNFCGYSQNQSDNYWHLDDLNYKTTPERMPEKNCETSEISAFYDDIFEHEAQKFKLNQNKHDTYQPKILGACVDGLDEAYKYCVEHNIPNNTFVENNAEFSEIDLYC